MSTDKSDRQTAQPTETNDDRTRRRFLKGTAVAGVAAAGVGVGAAQTSAQWWSSGVETFDLDGLGAADELPNSDESELVVYLHGAGVGDSAGDQGQSLEDGLADAGYDTTVVAGVFTESEVSIGGETSTPAENLAGLIEDYHASTGGTIRIIGYSLGGILTMQTLNALDDTVATAGSLGTGTPDSTVCEGEVYHDGIANNAEDFYVLYSENDSAITGMNAMEPDCDGIGTGPAPDNLNRVDVTSDVSDHLSYLDSDLVMDELAAAFEGSDDGDGDEDGSTWW